MSRAPPAARSPVPCVVWTAWVLVAALALASTARAEGTKPKPKPGPKFEVFEGAWTGGSPEKIVGCMDPEGTATFQLLAYPLSGKARVMKPDQAKAMLKAYVKRVSSMKLKDVSPKKSPKNIRLYDYTYKPSGENNRTTHLRVQLKQDEKDRWVLASVTESAKPRG